jgi:hypothetical protein
MTYAAETSGSMTREDKQRKPAENGCQKSVWTKDEDKSSAK